MYNEPEQFNKLIVNPIFQINPKLAETINFHNKYVQLLASGHKTKEDLALIAQGVPALFYENETHRNIIIFCLAIEEELAKIAKADHLATYKNSYWASLANEITDLFSTDAGAYMLVFPLLSIIFPSIVPVMSPIAIAFTVPLAVISLLLITTILYTAFLDKEKAVTEYNAIYRELSVDDEDLSNDYVTNIEDKHRFFSDRKQAIRQDIVAFQVEPTSGIDL